MTSATSSPRQAVSTPVRVMCVFLSGLPLLLAPLRAQVTPAALAPAPDELREVRFWSPGEVTRIALETGAEAKFKYDKLDNPARIFVDLYDVRPKTGAAMRTIPVNDGIVKQIRIALTQKNVTRVVLDLEEASDVSASQLSNPERVMLEIHPLKSGAGNKGQTPRNTPPAPAPASSKPSVAAAAPPVTAPAAAASAPRPAANLPVFSPVPGSTKQSRPPALLADVAPVPRLRTGSTVATAASRYISVLPKLAPPPGSAAARVDEPPVSSPATPPIAKLASASVAPKAEPKAEPADTRIAKPAESDRLGNRSLTRVLGLKLERVVLDAGHGGHDTGTISRNGLIEKELVLDVTLRLGKLIEDRLGAEVVYTRADDTFIPLQKRTEIANQKKADLFLSIHANSSPIKGIAGTETFYLNFTTSREDMDVAARENAGSEQTVHDLSELVRKIALKDKVDESREFAARIQTSTYELSSQVHGRIKNRGVKKAPFVVLIGADMPSVLTEIGFMSNSKEEALLKRPEHRQKIAESLYKGIFQYTQTLSHYSVAAASQPEVPYSAGR